MQLQTINAINAFGLILISVYRYYTAHTPDTSNLVPIFFGVLLLVCNSGIEYNNRAMINMAIGLTTLGIIGLGNQLYKHVAIHRPIDTILISYMILTSVISLFFFIRYYWLRAKR